MLAICYNIYSKRKELTTMATWYTVNYGAITCEPTFDTYEDAEIFALAMAVVTGDHYHVEFACGMPV